MVTVMVLDPQGDLARASSPERGGGADSMTSIPWALSHFRVDTLTGYVYVACGGVRLFWPLGSSVGWIFDARRTLVNKGYWRPWDSHFGEIVGNQGVGKQVNAIGVVRDWVQRGFYQL